MGAALFPLDTLSFGSFNLPSFKINGNALTVFLVHDCLTVNEIWGVQSRFVTPLSSLGPVLQVDTAMLELEHPEASEV